MTTKTERPNGRKSAHARHRKSVHLVLVIIMTGATLYGAYCDRCTLDETRQIRVFIESQK